jgi:hypothetical protein
MLKSEIFSRLKPLSIILETGIAKGKKQKARGNSKNLIINDFEIFKNVLTSLSTAVTANRQPTKVVLNF